MGAACTSEVATEQAPLPSENPDANTTNVDNNNTHLLAIKYVNGKYTPVFKYDSVANSWSEIYGIPMEGFFHVTLAGGRFYFTDISIHDVYCFNPETGSIRSLENLRDGSLFCCVTEFQGKFVIVGGTRSTKTVRTWDTDKERWLTLPKMLVGHEQGAAVEHEGCLYVAGGNNENHAVECYNPRSRSWRRCANLKQWRSLAKLVSARGYIYCVGGTAGEVPTNVVERYDPRIDKWIELHCMLAPKIYIGCAYFQNHLLAAGAQTFDTTELEEYDEQRNVWFRRKDTEFRGPKNLFVASADLVQKLNELRLANEIRQ